MNHKKTIEILYCGLKDFGLNPVDWLLVPVGETENHIQFEVNSIEEHDLRLFGRAEKNRHALQWQNLEWQM